MKKETSAVIGIAAVLLILCSAFCGAAAADGGNVAKIGTAEYATVLEAVNAAQPGDTIEMIADSAEPMITIDKEIILNLAGHVLRNSETGSVLLIPEPGNLTIIDEKAANIPADTPHYFTFVKAGPWKLETTAPAAGTTVDLADFDRAAAEAAPEDSYHIKVSGGVVTGGSGSGHGGAVNIFRGLFTLSGGNLVGNTADSGGGAVYVGSDISTVTMNNGTIAGNWTPNGGGAVYVAVESRFAMNGGKIIGNAAGTVGGAVNVTDGTFAVSGGSITQNSAGVTGGAVYVDEGCTLTVSGAPVIRDNKAGGNVNNVYLASGKIIITGALKNGAAIGVVKAGAESADAFAQGTSSYTVTADDARIFSSDSGSLAAAADSNVLKWSTKPAATPAPFLSILAGLGAAAAAVRMRRK